MSDGTERFDRLYKADPDPWNYEGEPDEAFKRRAIAQALGGRRAGAGVELGCGPGVSTASLAPLFERLMAIDGSEEAVTLARARLSGCRRVVVRQEALPCALPRQRFRAAIASEVLYYLPRRDRLAQLAQLEKALVPGGILVLCHHLARFGDAHAGGAAIAREAAEIFGSPQKTRAGAGWRLDVFRAPSPRHSSPKARARFSAA